MQPPLIGCVQRSVDLEVGERRARERELEQRVAGAGPEVQLEAAEVRRQQHAVVRIDELPARGRIGGAAERSARIGR